MSRRQKYVPLKNTFSFPNDIFILGLCPGELAVYSYLLCCANRKTGQCWPSYRAIGKAVGMTENTVAKYVGSLEHKGLICTEPTTVPTKAGKRRNGNLMYTILPIQEVIDRHIQHQLDELELASMRAQHAKTPAPSVIAPVSHCKEVCAHPTGRVAYVHLQHRKTRRWPSCSRCWASAPKWFIFPHPQAGTNRARTTYGYIGCTG